MIVGDVAGALRNWYLEKRISAPGAPGMRSCASSTPGNWYRTVRWDPDGRRGEGCWVVVSEGSWDVNRTPYIAEAGWLDCLDLSDAATWGALLGLWQEYDGPLAQVELSSVGTSLGVVWQLLSDSRHHVACGPTPGIAIARGICGLAGWTLADVEEYKRRARVHIGPDGMWAPVRTPEEG